MLWGMISRVTKFLSTPSARRATPSASMSGRTARRFLSTPSARRATISSPAAPPQGRYFYPRPPRGGRQHNSVIERTYSLISIHALREEGDLHFLCLVQVFHISIHALREEGDLVLCFGDRLHDISIHALREEGDSKNRDKISIFL